MKNHVSMKEAAPGDVNFIARSFVCVLILSKNHLKQFHRCQCGSSCSSNLFSFVEWWWPRYYHQISKCWRRAPRFDDVAIEGEEFHFFLLCRGNAATTAAAQLWQQLLLLWKAPLRANQLPLVGAEESDWNAAQRRNAADVSRPFQLGRCWLFVDFERVAARGVLNRKKPLFIFWNLCFKFSLILKEKYFAPKDRFRTKSCLKNELWSNASSPSHE